MKTFTNTILLLVLCTQAFSQTKISGIVKDKKGEAIVGANIYIKDSYDGSSTDIHGTFSFVSSEEGPHVLVITSIGFKTMEQEVVLNGKAIQLSFELIETINKLDAVVISAGSFNAGDEGKKEVLKPLDIVTTAGSSADIAGALNTLPGTQTVGETGRLFVRGGSGFETKTFIDGMQVLNTYSPSVPNTPSRGRFSPFMFSGTSFSTGGYSAEYGQALSSALILNTKDKAMMDRADISLMSVGTDVSATKVWEKSSFSGKVQYTNIAPYFGIIKQKLDLVKAPSSLDGNFAIRRQINENGMLKFYGNFNHSNLVVNISDIDEPSIKDRVGIINDYQYLNIFYKDVLNERWSIKTGISYTNSKDDIDFNVENSLEHQKGIHTKIVLSNDVSDKLALNFGSEVFYRDYTLDLESAEGETYTQSFSEPILASFLETDIYTSKNFVTRAGARLEHIGLNGVWSISPRLSFGYKTGENSQVSLAYGKFQQQTENSLLRVNNDLRPEKSDHYILNYQVINTKRTFRIEAYYKDYKDLVKYDDSNISDPTGYDNTGVGHARGIDIFWRDNQTLKNVDYWISYSFLDTKRDYRNFPYSAVPRFASSHNFSVVYKHFIEDIKSQIGATYSFTSARPFHDPNQSGFNAGRTKNYHDLSMNVSYLFRSNVIFHAFITNVLGTRQIFGYEYGNQLNTHGQYNRRAIAPPASRFIFLGVFITLAKDKTFNGLPNL
ncbi:TonB-dependent receptor [Fulvivirgaceae bacterium BMA10]|uniref:TonB-dependent receptor n=1 Tax=Splendidivirga corallicola TaxID=3051826 RepID=A0ABT8KWI2_9BACT|nr:TonB-dependent receptor [Fulvivirgaceae bacterium BMA10]